MVAELHDSVGAEAAVRTGSPRRLIFPASFGRRAATSAILAFGVLVVMILGSGCSAHTKSRAVAPTTAAAVPAVQSSVEHLDAHDGGIVQAGSTFYEFGTSYDCGFEFGVVGTEFCGISIYSSPDLRTWKSAGLAFDPHSADWQQACTPGGCFRPHVVYDKATSQYVMWINVFTGAYRVLTSPSPTGPWTLDRGAGAVTAPSGDENFFVDTDGVGFLIRTDLRGRRATTKTHELEVDRLDPSYTHVTRQTSRPPVGFVEAPTLWQRDGVYYLAYSDPACPYCTGTGTSRRHRADTARPLVHGLFHQRRLLPRPADACLHAHHRDRRHRPLPVRQLGPPRHRPHHPKPETGHPDLGAAHLRRQPAATSHLSLASSKTIRSSSTWSYVPWRGAATLPSGRCSPALRRRHHHPRLPVPAGSARDRPPPLQIAP